MLYPPYLIINSWVHAYAKHLPITGSYNHHFSECMISRDLFKDIKVNNLTVNVYQM